MADATLKNCRILVVEDEYMMADDLDNELSAIGAIVLGPVATVADAIAIIQSGQHIDGAILDVNLGGDMIFPAADMLAERKVRFVFTTGYDPASIPDRFGHIERCEKPVNMRMVARAIGRVIHEGMERR